MEEAELERIRAQRLNEMKSGGNGGGQQEEEKQKVDMRRSILAQILENSARERLNRISIVKPEKSQAVEDLIIRMAQSGRVQKRLTEQDIIDLLSQLSQDKPKSSVLIHRRRYSDSDEEYNF